MAHVFTCTCCGSTVTTLSPCLGSRPSPPPGAPGAASEVYVVMGTCGEYSDRNEWPVRVHLDEKRAAEHVAAATKRASELATVTGRYGRAEPGANEHDPDMQSDYTGTSYFIYKVPMASTPGAETGGEGSRRIVLTKRSGNYHACIEGQPGKWGGGAGSYEAIGNLVNAWREEFGVEIVEAGAHITPATPGSDGGRGT